MSSHEFRAPVAHRWIKPVAVVLIATAAAGYAGRNFILGVPVETHRAMRGDLVQTVVASGRIMSAQRVSVGAVLTERVADIPVQEGQKVKRGEILIRLDDSDELAAAAQAQAAIGQAEARMRQLREVALPAAEQGLAQAQANLVQARQQYDRTQALLTKGFISQAALDDSKHNLDIAESQLRAARLQVQTTSPAGSDYALAVTALEQARASLRAAQARLAQTVIAAPVNGTLIGRNVEPGDVVQPGKELMVLAPAGEMQVVLQIDEKNLSQLNLGQKAVGSADAFPRERFAAEVFYINPGIDALRGSVEVKLRVLDPPAYLRQDMTVSIDIEVGRRNGVVLIPSDAVHDAAGGQPWVIVVSGRTTVRRPVKLGLKGEGKVEVVEGVEPEEVLVLASAGAISPGRRVRATSSQDQRVQ